MLPASLGSIGYKAFHACENLVSVSVAARMGQRSAAIDDHQASPISPLPSAALLGGVVRQLRSEPAGFVTLLEAMVPAGGVPVGEADAIAGMVGKQAFKHCSSLTVVM